MVLADAPVAAPPASSLRGGGRTGSASAQTRTWSRLALFAAAMLTALGSLSAVLADVWWWLPPAAAVVVLVLTTGIAKAVARRGWQRVLLPPVVAILLLTLAFARDQAALGILPTFDVLHRWGELAGLGFYDIANQRVPADASEGIVFLLVVLAGACVLVIAPLLDRLPATAAVPLLVLLDIPVAVREGIAAPGWYVVTALLFLALLRVGRRRAQLTAVVATAAIVVVGSLVLAQVFPPSSPTRAGSGGGAIGNGINPLIDLGDDLRRNDPVTAVTYTTDAPGGIYLRLATMDDFNGQAWEPDATIQRDVDLTDFPSPEGLSDDVPRATYTADITVHDIGGRWLPVPYPSTSVTGLDGGWGWEPDGLTVRSNGTDVSGQDYEASFLDVEPNLEQLTLDADPDLGGRYTRLPIGVPDIVTTTAQQIAAGSTSEYETAIRLQDYFTDGSFDYSTEAPVDEGYDGTGLSVMAEFLEKKSGYCVHFASTMAVMARVLGIPSRVVVGFQPGESDTQDDGTQVYTVMSTDLHAWPELYFEGIGWLRFEPTPGRGELPSYSSVDAVDDPATDEFEGVNPTAAPVTPTQDPTDADQGPDAEVPDTATVGEAASPVPVLLGVLLAILALLLIPAFVRVGIRSARLRRVRHRDAAAAWDEIRDTAHDHDWSAPDSETPRQLGARLAVVVGSEAVQPLQHSVEATAYDRPGSGRLTVDDVTALRHAIADAAALRVRLKAVFLPPSLLTRLGFGAPRDPAG